MEPVAIISDIHGNLQALQAVIADIESQGIRERVCLGDIVGYGAQPVECLELIRAKNFRSVQGNHDAYVAADDDPSGISDETKKTILWTRRILTQEQRAWLGSLPMISEAEDYEAVHSSLNHPEQWGYVLEPGAATQHFLHQRKNLCFIGHSHRPAMFVEGEDHALDLTSLESVRPERKQVINVGSVGQPRDKDPRACYLIYHREKQDVWWRRMDYDIEGAQNAIAAAGLPGRFAYRLGVGK